MTGVANYRRRTDLMLASLRTARQRVREERKAFKEANRRLEGLQTARELVQQIAQEIQERAHDQIAKVVCRSLEVVFDDPYEFRILFEKKRGKTEARLVFLRHGKEIDPMTASGGGVVDVAAFALRLSCLMLHRPALRKVLVLDEPFRFVSPEYRDRVASLLKALSDELGVQIIMVTHMDELSVGSVSLLKA